MKIFIKIFFLKSYKFQLSFEINFAGSVVVSKSDLLEVAANGLNDIDLSSFDVVGLSNPIIAYNYFLSSNILL